MEHTADSRSGVLVVASAVVLAAFGALAVRALLASRRNGYPEVRPSGPQAMRDPPPNWDRVDEDSDQSFPASDPPGNY